MVFEFWMDTGDARVAEEYGAISEALRAEVAGVEGFAGVERFESCSEPGKFLALAFFADEEAVARWRNSPAHRRAQELGRRRALVDYRLRMAEVIRDYGPHRRTEAPLDSNRHHGGA